MGLKVRTSGFTPCRGHPVAGSARTARSHSKTSSLWNDPLMNADKRRLKQAAAANIRVHLRSSAVNWFLSATCDRSWEVET